MSLMPLIESLEASANHIDSKWSVSGYDLNQFPDMAHQELQRLGPLPVPTLKNVFDELGAIKLPLQTFPTGSFSDFPLTLVRRPHFHYDLYFWFRSDTSIHNHNFAGAFRVMNGISYQVNYTFEEELRIDSALIKGKLNLCEAQLFRQGHVEKIDPQDKFIHHVFHIAQPTITLALRTPVLQDQFLWSFIFPGYKIRYQDYNQTKQKWLHSLTTLHQCTPSVIPERLENMPVSTGEILRLIIQANAGDSPLNPLHELLLKSSDASVADFYQHLQTQHLLNQKHKKFAYALALPANTK